MEPILLAGEVHLRLFFRRRKGNTLFRQNGIPLRYGKISR
jgi:hypothetical protein